MDFSILSNIIHQEFHASLPFISTAIISVSFLIAIITVWFRSSNPLTIIYTNGCNRFNYQFQYLVRLLYTGISTNFNHKSAIITVQMKHSIFQTTEIEFTPETMKQLFVYKGCSCAKLFVRTVERFNDLRSISLHHNGSGTILIHSIEVQDLDQSNAIISSVNYPISNLNTMRKVSPFPFGSEKRTLIETDICPTLNITLLESIFFLYNWLMVIFVANVVSLSIKCSEPKVICRFDKIFLFGFTSYTLSFIIFLGLILPFRYLVKPYYHRQLGRGCSKFTLTLYLLGVLLLSLIAATFTGDMSTRQSFFTLNNEALIFRPETIWLLSTIFSVFLMICTIGLILPLAIWIGFIRLPDDFDWRRRFRLGRRKFLRYGEIFYDDGESSYSSRSLMADQQSPNRKPQETYFNALARQKKTIHSISTFIKNEPSKSLSLQANRPNRRPNRLNDYENDNRYDERVFERRPRQQNRLEDRIQQPIIPLQSDIDRRGGGQPQRGTIQDLPESTIATQSSSGENYYERMMKMAKIRSISQYKN